MMPNSNIENLARACAYLATHNPDEPYSFAAAVETGEIVECAVLAHLLDILNHTQFSGTQCALFRAEGGEWVADGYYFVTEEED